MNENSTMEDLGLLEDVLLRTSRGQASFEELAESLNQLENVVQIIPSGEFTRFMGDMNQALKDKGYGNVNANDAEQPRVAGIRTEDGRFVPWVFTDDAIAREFAIAKGMIQPDEALSLITRPPDVVLYECLAAGQAGLVIDEGSDHKINMQRNVVARLYGLVTFGRFVALPELQAVIHENKVFYQQPKQGEGLQAFVYDSTDGAMAGIARIQEKAPAISFQAAPTLPHIANLLKAGVTLLVVNPALASERTYNREDLERMASAGEAEPRPDPTPDSNLKSDPDRREAAGSDPALNLPELLRKATAYPAFPMVPPPGRDDPASQVRFQELRLQAESKEINVWEYVEALAFDLDVYTPVHERPVDGLTWPMIYAHHSEEGKTISYAYSGESRVREQLSANPEEARNYHRLSGIEAMRWVWAAPREIHEVAINLYKDTDGWLSFPSYWAVSAAFPLFYAIPDLGQVSRVPLTGITALPGARGLKPEVARALIEGWKLLVLSDAGAASPASLVDYRGLHCVPLFCDQEQFFAFQSVHPGNPCSVLATGEEPPFERLLRASAGCDGVLLDPAGPRPLLLEHGDLLALALWARNSGPAPHGGEVAIETAMLLGEGVIDSATAGRIAACWPRYFAGLHQKEDGGAELLMTPDADRCAVFSSMELAGDYIAASENLGLIPRGTMKPVPILHRWQYNIFQTMAASFTLGGVIDPVAGGGGGLYLDPQAVEAAIRHVDRMLKPRVDGFVAGE